LHPRSRIGLGAVFEGGAAERDSVLHMHVARGGYVGTALAENGLTSVAAAVDASLIRDAGSPSEAVRLIMPADTRALLDSRDDIRWSGTPPLTQRRPVAGERIFLAGDAARYVEPMTGEGIAWALRSAMHLAPIATDALGAWSSSHARRWRSMHAKLLRRDARRCRLIAALLRRPRMCRAAMRLHASAAPGWAALIERPLGDLLSADSRVRA
jgi:flavin-dependent dehydrogenase